MGFGSGGTFAQTHPFSIHDMLAMDRISDPQVSPDGKTVVFVVRRTDLEANRGRTDLYLVGTDGSSLRRLTTDPAGDFNPRWAPGGGSIYFLSTRSESSQVWRIRIDGGEAEQITDEPLDVGNLIVAPDGKHLGFTMEVFPGATAAETKERLDEIEAKKDSGIIYDRIFIRHWDAWKDGRRLHLFVMSAEGGAAVDVMKNMDADTPSKPFGGPEEITFSPDSKSVVFAARNVGKTEPWSTNFDLYQAPIDGSTIPVCLTPKNQAWDTMPCFSGDGTTLAYLAMARPGYESDRFRIILRGWPNGPERVLTEDWDRSVGSFCWAGDGKTIYAAAGNIGQTCLFAIDVQTSQVRSVVNEGTVSSPSATGNLIIYAWDDLRAPAELYSIKADSTNRRAITGINAAKVAAAAMGEFEQFSFKGWNDETVYGFVVKPIDFDPQKKYPVAFLIHGGPQGSFSNHFHYRWNPQVYAGAGYGTIMIDFHGSTGYGQAFTDSIRGNWGSRPFEDLQKGLTAALERYRWMDEDRVGALGASYGGYMINWIAGNWPDRFRCLVNHDGLFDTNLGFYATEELWFPEWEFSGTPWANPAAYEKYNPKNHVVNWNTPMLVIQGLQDFRVPNSHAYATFNALQRRGIESKLLIFPDENHWVLQPQNSILWHEIVLNWLDQWVEE
ncbi:MAG: peptidase S9 [Phycisphaerae bacterium SM23_30]|nr:MAG: peptidase S9 [Phycisphaerae bacterium SM23_30]